MLANKKIACQRLLLVFILMALLSTMVLWLITGKPANWFRWDKPEPRKQMLELIRTRYVDSLSVDSLENQPLDSLVYQLDPHSAYLPPSIVKSATEDLAGHFAGIGIEFGSIRDTITVIRHIPGGPSEKILQIGDQLLFIGGRSLTDSSITLDSIRVIVRGPVGSDAQLTVRRNGKNRLVIIRRSNIPTPSIVGQYMLNDTTGYIKLTKFASGSYRETVTAIDSLKGKGMRALVLDLRGNGGGFMQEAVELADEFLSDDRLIVYTQGVHSKKRSYQCKRPGLFETGKLFVLVNELTASASEVLAGALQDWCRATILGRRSYGKGLVQEQYELSNNGALRLTVARYYTPLGRCIQRPYTHNRAAYLLDSVWIHSIPPKPTQSSTMYLNPCGDTLFAGGGIWPDIFVDKINNRMSASAEKIMNNSEIVLWSYAYYQRYKKSIDSITDLTTHRNKIPVASIRNFLTEKLVGSGYIVDGFTSTDWPILAFEVYAQIARFRFGPGAYTRFLNSNDPFIQIALSHL